MQTDLTRGISVIFTGESCNIIIFLKADNSRTRAVSPLCPAVADVASDLMSPAQGASTENYPRFLSPPGARMSGLGECCCAWESARVKPSLQKPATKAFVHHLTGESSLSGLPKADFRAVTPSRQQGTVLPKLYFFKFTAQ